MSDKITDLPVANTIDATNDVLAIVTDNIDTTQQINRNTLLGITSQPLGLTDTQSPTNKTFDNTNTITINDDAFRIDNVSDPTKSILFEASSITTGTTRTITVPDADLTLVGVATTQTLTNKTLTSPTINSPTITNATLSADAITGYSASTTGTIFGISVTSGTIAAAGIASNAVTYPKLSTDSTWAWTTFTPSPTGYTGSVTINLARYTQIGKTVIVHLSFTGTSNATTCTFTLPVSAKSTNTTGGGLTTVTDNSSVQTSPGLVVLASSSTTATCYKTQARGAFTNSGTKAVSIMSFVYEAA